MNKFEDSIIKLCRFPPADPYWQSLPMLSEQVWPIQYNVEFFLVEECEDEPYG